MKGMKSLSHVAYAALLLLRTIKYQIHHLNSFLASTQTKNKSVYMTIH